MSLHTRTVQTREEFAAIEGAWMRLYDRQADPLPSLHWRWFDAFWRHLAPATARPLVLTAWRGDELVGAAAMTMGTRRVGGIAYRVLSGLENAHTPAYGWLLPPEPSEADDVAGALAEAAAALDGGVHALSWENAVDGHPGTVAVERALARLNYRLASRPRRSPALIRFPGGSRPFVDSLSAKMRSRLRGGWARLARQGPVTFEEVSRSPGLPDLLASAWQLEDSGWKGAAGSSIARNPALRGFYDELAIALAPSGRMRLFLLRCGDDLVAFSYNLADGGLIHGLKIGHAPEYASASPGYLTVWKIIEWCDEHGVTRFNLSGAESSWKSHWGGEPQRVRSLQAFPRTARGTSLFMALVGWKQQVERVPGTRSVARLWRERRNAHLGR